MRCFFVANLLFLVRFLKKSIITSTPIPDHMVHKTRNHHPNLPSQIAQVIPIRSINGMVIPKIVKVSTDFLLLHKPTKAAKRSNLHK